MDRTDPKRTWHPENEHEHEREITFRRPGSLRHSRSLRLLLTSERQSGARIDIALLDGAGSRIGRTVRVSIDWAGENDLRLWSESFLERDEDRDATCERVRLSLHRPGLFPTAIDVVEAELLDTEPSWKVDGPDTVIEAGWSYAAAAPFRWKSDVTRTDAGTALFVMSPERPNSEPGAAGLYTGLIEYRGTAPWLTLGYRQEGPPRRASFRREFERGLRLAGFSEILFKATWDRAVALDAIAETDEGEITICSGERSTENFRTFAKKLGGTRLMALRFTLNETAESNRDRRDVALGLFWVLLREPSELDDSPVNTVLVRKFGIWDAIEDEPSTELLRVPMPHFDEPKDSATPIGDPLTHGLPYGFYVTRDSLPELRERCLCGASKPMFETMRREADRAIACELVDRNTYGNSHGWGGVGKPKGYRGAGMLVFAPVVAFVHLVTGEASYAEACRRWILRAAASDRWLAEHGGPSDIPRGGEETFYDDIFTGTHPKGFWGYMDHHFFVADAALGIATSYEMLYHCFNEEERRTVELAMVEHGLFHLWDKMISGWDFYVKMNQGVLIALPLLMQTRILIDRDTSFRELFDRTVEFFTEFSRNPWNEEGVMGEGPSYGNGTLAEFLAALPVLAACTGKPEEEFLPPEPENLLSYLCHCRSTWRTPGTWPHFLGLSDGSEYGWISTEVLVYFARRRRNPVAEYLLQELAEPPHPTIPNILYDGQAPEPERPDLPPIHAFRDQPMVFFRTGWEEGDSHVMMNALSQVTCHGHKDRGTIIFELGGEALVTDPGMISYNDTRARQYQETFCHNCLTVDGASQLGGFGRFDVRLLAVERVMPQRTGDSTVQVGSQGHPLEINYAVVDLAAVYAGVSQYRRHLIYLRPATVILYDQVILDEPGTVTLNLNLLGTISSTDHGFVATSRHHRLQIAAAGTDRLIASTVDWETHWPELVTHRLMLESVTPRVDHHLVTVLSAEPERIDRYAQLGRTYLNDPSWDRYGRDVLVEATENAIEASIRCTNGCERVRVELVTAGQPRRHDSAHSSVVTLERWDGGSIAAKYRFTCD